MNCFRFIAYLGLWRPGQLNKRRPLRRELLSIYCLPWSLTTRQEYIMRFISSWIAFDLLLTLVFDDFLSFFIRGSFVVNCFRFIAYLGLWRRLGFSIHSHRGRELLSIYCLPWSLTTQIRIYLKLCKSWIAFDLLLTLVFDDIYSFAGAATYVVNCFRFIAYLGLWRQPYP